MKKALIGYAFFVLIGLVFVASRPDDRLAHRPRVDPMANEIVTNATVLAKPTGIWTWVVEYVKGPAQILVEASGEWFYASGKKCGPDGDLKAFNSADSTLLPSAPWGSLLVKIGGSTAGAGDGSVHVAGSRALVVIEDKVSGPVFLTINDEVSGLDDNTGSLEVKVTIRH
jgi:hypothetical protein